MILLKIFLGLFILSFIANCLSPLSDQEKKEMADCYDDEDIDRVWGRG